MSFWVTIPSYTSRTLSGGNAVVHYLVGVGVQLEGGERVRHSVLRRFSDFRQLHSQLVAQFGSKKVPEPPQKKSILFKVSTNTALLETRRMELEQWVWRLLADIQLAHSHPLAQFLDLNHARQGKKYPAALDRVNDPPRPSNTQEAGPAASSISSSTSSATHHHHPITGAIGMSHSEGGAPAPLGPALVSAPDGGWPSPPPSHHARISFSTPPGGGQGGGGGGYASDDSSSEASTSKTQGFPVDVPGGGPCSHSLQGTPPPHTSAAEPWLPHGSTDVAAALAAVAALNGPPPPSAGTSPPTTASLQGPGSEVAGGVEGVRTRRLGVAVEQRGGVRRLMADLNRRLATTQQDLQECVAALRMEAAVKELLEEKLKEQGRDLEDLKASWHQDLLDARQSATAAKWSEQEAQAQLTKEREINSENALQLQHLQHQLANTQERSGDVEELLARVSAVEEERDQKVRELEDAHQQAKAEKKLLSKEVRSLRKSLQAAQEDATKAQQTLQELQQNQNGPTSQAESLATFRGFEGFTREVSNLRQRLQECTLDRLAEGGGGSASTGDSVEQGMEMLETSDNRISCLLAEAHLLSQVPDDPSARSSGASDPSALSLEPTIREMFAQLLAENAQLRKSQNSLLRNALVQSNSNVLGHSNASWGRSR